LKLEGQPTRSPRDKQEEVFWSQPWRLLISPNAQVSLIYVKEGQLLPEGKNISSARGRPKAIE
jgi:hypothetical protein